MNQDTNPLIGRLRELTEQVAAREGCRLYDLEFVGGSKGRGRVLRIYIDKQGAEGVSVDDCANVSRGLNLLLDVEDAMPGGAYTLEVSSPGLERPLKEAWHFQEALGKKIAVKLTDHVEAFNPDAPVALKPAKQLKGVLKELTNGPEGETAILVQDGNELKFPVKAVHRGHIVYEFEQSAKPGAHHGHDKKKR